MASRCFKLLAIKRLFYDRSEERFSEFSQETPQFRSLEAPSYQASQGFLEFLL